MKKKSLENTLRNIKRLDWLNKELENLNNFSIKLSEKDRKCKIDLSFKLDKDEKVTLDDDGSIQFGRTHGTSTYDIMMGMSNYSPKNIDTENYKLKIDEVVMLSIIKYLQEGLLMEKQHIEGILIKQKIS